MAVALIYPRFVLAAADAEGTGKQALEPLVLVGIAVILIVAKLGGEFFDRLNQPAVLGELIVGIVVGNLALIGFHGVDFLKTN